MTIDKKRVSILCTGNSARSQMAEGLLRRNAGDLFEVASAGTQPRMVRPEAIAAMGFDGQRFDYVITVCDHAKESCPVFPGAVKRFHQSFEDPPPISERSEEERMAIFRRVRDEIRSYLEGFAKEKSGREVR